MSEQCTVRWWVELQLSSTPNSTISFVAKGLSFSVAMCKACCELCKNPMRSAQFGMEIPLQDWTVSPTPLMLIPLSMFQPARSPEECLGIFCQTPPALLILCYRYLRLNERPIAVTKHFWSNHAPISFDYSIALHHPSLPWMPSTQLPLWHLLGHSLPHSRNDYTHIHEATIAWEIKFLESSSSPDEERLGGKGSKVCYSPSLVSMHGFHPTMRINRIY